QLHCLLFELGPTPTPSSKPVRLSAAEDKVLWHLQRCLDPFDACRFHMLSKHTLSKAYKVVPMERNPYQSNDDNQVIMSLPESLPRGYVVCDWRVHESYEAVGFVPSFHGVPDRSRILPHLRERVGFFFPENWRPRDRD